MALKTFNVQGGLSIGNKGDIFDANANLNLSNSIANVTLGNVGNLHIAGGNANSAILGSVTLDINGNVTAIAISSRGDGYTIAPAITISGANSGTANATVSLFANGALNTITINDAGTGYNSGTVTATVAGPSGRYLKTDGAGNLSWFEVQSTGGGGGGGTPGGSNTYIQFNDNGAFNGTDGFTFDKVTNAITAGGTITASDFSGANLHNGNSEVSIAANANVVTSANGNVVLTITSSGDGNLITTGANVDGYIHATGNIIGSNLIGTLANGNSNIAITANANITLTAKSNATMVISDTGANITGTGNFSGNLTSANLITGIANVTGDILAGGNVNVTSNINGATFQNGNASVRLGANGNVGLTANGQSNVLLVTSNGTHAQSTFQNDLTVTGNLTVQGNAIYANTETLTIEDPIIELGTGANASILITNDGKDRGVELHSYGNGAAYTTSGSTPSGNTTIVLASTSGIVSGQLVTCATNPNAIPVGTTVSTVNAGNIVISNATTNTIAGTTTLQIGNDILRFMGWSNANAEFQFYSDATVTNEIVTGTLGNVNAATFIGAFQGNLVNGNSNIRIAANSNVSISSNGQSNVFVVSGTGANITGTGNFSGNLSAANLIGPLANGNSNVNIPSSNGNVNITAVGNTTMVITGTGANITGTANVSGNANVGNLGTTTAIITTGNITTVNTGLVQNGNSNIAITSNANITLTANSNAVIVVTSSGDGNLQTTGANIDGYVNATGNVNGSNLVIKAAGSLSFTTGTSNVGANTVTTTTTTANQAIAVVAAADGRTVEFIVKGFDSTGVKYSAATILALVGNAANADCDFTTFAQLNTGLTTGDITVALTDGNSNITLQVTPASTNSTVWTTQYRVI